MHVPTSAPLDERIHSRIAKAIEKPRNGKPVQPVLGVLGAVIRTRTIKLAVAAILISAIIGLHQFGSSIRGTNIVWADVAERLAKVRSYRSQGRRVFTEVGQAEPFFECDILRHFSPDHGSVEESYEDGELVMLAYCSLAEMSAIAVFPENKVYCRLDLNEELLSMVEFTNPTNTEGMMKLFGSDRCTRLGPREIDGITAEGFEVKGVQILSHVPRFLLHVDGVDIRVWVDEETLLPMRIEGVGLVGTELPTRITDFRYEEVMHTIEYDIEIDDTIFDPNIPDDYLLIDPAQKPGISIG